MITLVEAVLHQTEPCIIPGPAARIGSRLAQILGGIQHVVINPLAILVERRPPEVGKRIGVGDFLRIHNHRDGTVYMQEKVKHVGPAQSCLCNQLAFDFGADMLLGCFFKRADDFGIAGNLLALTEMIHAIVVVDGVACIKVAVTEIAHRETFPVLQVFRPAADVGGHIEHPDVSATLYGERILVARRSHVVGPYIRVRHIAGHHIAGVFGLIGRECTHHQLTVDVRIKIRAATSCKQAQSCKK